MELACQHLPWPAWPVLQKRTPEPPFFQLQLLHFSREGCPFQTMRPASAKESAFPHVRCGEGPGAA